MKRWTFILALAAIALLGFLQAGQTVAVGFCGAVDTDCGVLCVCGPPHFDIVPAWCCPESPCFGNPD